MTDWTQLVRDRLSATGVNLSDSVIAELAAHLQETYELASSEGIAGQEACKRALREIPDWSVLAGNIHRAQSKGASVNHRTKSLWIPALATFFAANVSLALCQFFGMRPRIMWIGELAMPLYLPWLATLPVCGAFGACLSQRAQGSALARLAAGLSPAFIMLIVMLLVLPVGFALDGLHFLQLVAFGVLLINWVVIPALALILGELLFLHFPGQRSM
jgi:hypothetical protein